MQKEEYFLNQAITKAWENQGLTFPNPAVGATIVVDDCLITTTSHQKAGAPHAEVIACQEAYAKLTKNNEILNLKDSAQIHDYLSLHHNNIFKNATIYTTLEPCNHYGKTPPCSLLLEKLGFKRVIIGQKELNEKAKNGATKLNAVFLNSQKAYDLTYPFFAWNKSRFVFFKLALRLNGSYDGGQISSPESMRYIHGLRDKIELIIIGGKTVRDDRPTLDSRLVGGKAPDVLILSNQKEFDQTIPLFKVPNRKVYIKNNLELINNYKFIMIEGGEQMMESTKNIVDYYLFFVAPTIKSGKSLKHTINLEILHEQKIGQDLLIWSKKIKAN